MSKVYVVLYWHVDFGFSQVDSVFENHNAAKLYIKNELRDIFDNAGDDSLRFAVDDSGNKAIVYDAVGNECESMIITESPIR